MKKSFLFTILFCITLLTLYSQGLPPGLSPELASRFSADLTKGSSSTPSGLSSPAPNMAMANKDYTVTAGDVYNLSFLAGNTPISYMITVDSNYKIRVSNLAVLSVANLKFSTLKKQVEEIVTKNYPMSGVQFTLITPGTFNIVVKGEVAQAREVSAWALTRLSQVVDAFKNQYGSIRNVELTSKDGEKKIYDLFKAEREGDFSQDPYVRPGDTVTILPYERKITINGAVKRPGTYELLPGENLNTLINYYADGFAHMADTNSIELLRTFNTSNITGEKIFLNESNVKDDYEILPYDILNIRSFNEQLPVVFVQGAITGDNSGRPSPDVTVSRNINFNIGETYEQFIHHIKGMFGSNADLTRAYVLRGDEVIALNIYDILYNNTHCDVKIEPNDLLTIPSKTLSVSVLGAVRVPGRYPYLPNKDWSYYVDLAGGFINERNSFDKVTIVDSDGNKLSKNDEITPETKITAQTNDFLYYFNTYAPIILTTCSVVTAVMGLITTFTK